MGDEIHLAFKSASKGGLDLYTVSERIVVSSPSRSDENA